jgi:hypothetical protein
LQGKLADSNERQADRFVAYDNPRVLEIVATVLQDSFTIAYPRPGNPLITELGPPAPKGIERP